MPKKLTQMNNYKISILMNCRDGETFLKKAIDSIYNQSYQKFEIIFIDNQSKDNSANIAQSYDNRLRYFKTPQPMTLYQARAYAVQFCTGDYFCVLDGDDYWKRNKLMQQVTFLSDNPEVTFIYGSAIYFYEAKKIKSILVNCLNLIKIAMSRSGVRSFEDLIANYNINFQTVMIKMNYVKECNFNSSFNYIGDFDFHLRIIAKFKIKPYYLKTVFSTTRIHNMQLTTTTPGKWLREVKVLLIQVIRPNTSKENSLLFMKEIARKRFVYFLVLNMPKQAFKSIKKYMIKDLYLTIVVLYLILQFYIKKTTSRFLK